MLVCDPKTLFPATDNAKLRHENGSETDYVRNTDIISTDPL